MEAISKILKLQLHLINRRTNLLSILLLKRVWNGNVSLPLNIFIVTLQDTIITLVVSYSSKRWMGLAADTATHAVVYAKLILANKDLGILFISISERSKIDMTVWLINSIIVRYIYILGIHVFIVQLRTREGVVLPGISIGDVGPKMGRNAVGKRIYIFDVL